MADLFGVPDLKITDGHRQQAQALLDAIKAENPEHASFLAALEEKVKSGAEAIILLPLLLLLPFARDNAFM